MAELSDESLYELFEGAAAELVIRSNAENFVDTHLAVDEPGDFSTYGTTEETVRAVLVDGIVELVASRQKTMDHAAIMKRYEERNKNGN
jgi:hypothetical protein